LDTIKLCKSLKKSTINERIIKQIVASSGSVAANYQEASCAMSKKDFVKCLKISRKEAKETMLWLSGLRESDPLCTEKANNLEKEAKELTYILTSIISKSDIKSSIF